MALEDTLEERNLELEESSRTCKKYKYVVVTIISVGTCELEINDRGRANISKLNSVLRDRNVTSKLEFTIPLLKAQLHNS